MLVYNMHTDSCFLTGKSHQVCQDYALSGTKKDVPYAIVADGCSSSPNTDIGARLVSHALTQKLPISDKLRHREITPDIIQVIETARNATSLLGLPIECLDSTLLHCEFIWSKLNSAPCDSPRMSENCEYLSCMVIGDGIIAARLRSGGIEAWRIECKNNSPEYLSYMLDDNRHARFISQFGVDKTVIRRAVDKSLHEMPKADFAYRIWFSDAYDIVALMSDGIATFDGMDWGEVVDNLMDFKNVTGSFVQRRMKRFVKECQEKGIHHYDDVAMAAIYTGDK